MAFILTSSIGFILVLGRKMWIDASGIDTDLLWSPISSFLMILVEITDSSSANSVSESFIMFLMSLA